MTILSPPPQLEYMLYKSTAESSGGGRGRSEEEELQAALEASMQVLH